MNNIRKRTVSLAVVMNLFVCCLEGLATSPSVLTKLLIATNEKIETVEATIELLKRNQKFLSNNIQSRLFSADNGERVEFLWDKAFTKNYFEERNSVYVAADGRFVLVEVPMAIWDKFGQKVSDQEGMFFVDRQGNIFGL